MPSQSLENIRLVDRTTIRSVRLDHRQRCTAGNHPADDNVERRGALDAFDKIDFRRCLANRIAAHETANLALVVHHERVVGAAVERLRDARRIDCEPCFINGTTSVCIRSPAVRYPPFAGGSRRLRRPFVVDHFGVRASGSWTRPQPFTHFLKMRRGLARTQQSFEHRSTEATSN